jgi:hypothetical protein
VLIDNLERLTEKNSHQSKNSIRLTHFKKVPAKAEAGNKQGQGLKISTCFYTAWGDSGYMKQPTINPKNILASYKASPRIV